MMPAPKNKESVDKFCNSLQSNYPSFYSKTPSINNPNPQTTSKPERTFLQQSIPIRQP